MKCFMRWMNGEKTYPEVFIALVINKNCRQLDNGAKKHKDWIFHNIKLNESNMIGVPGKTIEIDMSC